jgi:hypothetical protein
MPAPHYIPYCKNDALQLFDFQTATPLEAP